MIMQERCIIQNHITELDRSFNFFFLLHCKLILNQLSHINQSSKKLLGHDGGC